MKITKKNARLLDQFLSLNSSHSSANSLFIFENSKTSYFRFQNLSDVFSFKNNLILQNNKSSPVSWMTSLNSYE